MLTIVSNVTYMINKIVNWYFFLFNEKNYKKYITPKKRNPKPKTQNWLSFSFFLFSLNVTHTLRLIYKGSLDFGIS